MVRLVSAIQETRQTQRETYRVHTCTHPLFWTFKFLYIPFIVLVLIGLLIILFHYYFSNMTIDLEMLLFLIDGTIFPFICYFSGHR